MYNVQFYAEKIVLRWEALSVWSLITSLIIRLVRSRNGGTDSMGDSTLPFSNNYSIFLNSVDIELIDSIYAIRWNILKIVSKIVTYNF